MRIYLVTDRMTGEEKLVEAVSQAGALKVCVGERFTAEACNAATVATRMSDGMKLVRAEAKGKRASRTGKPPVDVDEEEEETEEEED